MFINGTIKLAPMTLKRILKESPLLSVDALQRFQREYDRRFVADEFTGFDKVRHTYSHMGKLLGRLAEYVQMTEDGHTDFSPADLKEKVIPDLLVYSIWLAEELGVDIEEAYIRRVVGNIQRLHRDRISLDELQGLEAYLLERFQE